MEVVVNTRFTPRCLRTGLTCGIRDFGKWGKREARFSSVQSCDRLGRPGDVKDDSAEILFQSFLQKAVASSSGTDREVYTSVQRMLHCHLQVKRLSGRGWGWSWGTKSRSDSYFFFSSFFFFLSRKRNPSPSLSAYQPSTLPLGQSGSVSGSLGFFLDTFGPFNKVCSSGPAIKKAECILVFPKTRRN